MTQRPDRWKYNVVQEDADAADAVDAAVKVDEPTAHELTTLRRVPARIPWTAFVIALVELCERFAFYGLSGPFQNYISNAYEGGANPGALGLGQATATAMTSMFSSWCYLTSIAGAVVADQYLGKYKAIVLFCAFYLIGLVVLVITSFPSSIEAGFALPGLVLAMFIIGLGTGGIKSNVAPLIAEQVTDDNIRTKFLASGEKVLIDPDLTIQRIYMIFYLCINIGSLSGIITTSMEHKTGFWSAYLLALCFFVLGVVVLVLGRKMYVVKPPKGSVIADSFKVLYIAFESKRGLDIAKPSTRLALNLSHVPWDDSFVDEVGKAVKACKVLIFFPLYYTVYFQMMNNFVSQAGTMELHGIPNDLMQNIDPITIILFIPILDRFIYPRLRRIGIPLKPIARITLGFIFGGLAMVYAAYVQQKIYSAPPCFADPLNCAAAKQPDGTIEHNKVHVLVQSPAYCLIALSEICASVTGLEYAFMQAPSSMKSFVNAIFLIMTAAGAAIAAAIAPVAKDPRLTWMYLGLAFTSLLTGCVFWVLFRNRDEVDEKRIENITLGTMDGHDET